MISVIIKYSVKMNLRFGNITLEKEASLIKKP